MTEKNEKPKRKRKSSRQRKAIERTTRGSKTICLPIEQESYSEIVGEATLYRAWLDEMYAKQPELFRQALAGGYRLHDRLPLSKKLPDIQLRRLALKTNDEVYSVRPSFVLSYMTGYTDAVEKGLFMLSFGVPFWAVRRVFGRNKMYWQRLTERLGHNSLVGTTVRKAEALPNDLVADEKHSEIGGKPAYIATTVAGDCVLAAALSPTADEAGLRPAYAQFRDEARNLAPDYQPHTVNLDGWKATWNVWAALFPNCPRSLPAHSFHSRAHRLNRFVYHDNWLHNLLVSSSMLPLWSAFVPNHRFR